MFRIVAVLVAFSCCFWEGNAVKCYSCDFCTIPFNTSSVATQDNCASCTIEQWIFNGEVRGETRACSHVCEPLNEVFKKSGKLTGCCTTDLCNEHYNASTRFAPYNGVLFCLLTIMFLITRL